MSFGPYVSPEYIDKNLPPSTPVRKGAAPKVATPKGTPKNAGKAVSPASLLKRSLKKTVGSAKLVSIHNVPK